MSFRIDGGEDDRIFFCKGENKGNGATNNVADNSFNFKEELDKRYGDTSSDTSERDLTDAYYNGDKPVTVAEYKEAKAKREEAEREYKEIRAEVKEAKAELKDEEFDKENKKLVEETIDEVKKALDESDKKQVKELAPKFIGVLP